ncbi:MAG: thioredoxin family protein [Candidatus Hydrogenedentes bacterium]|nr:thioredoxin family protein [Candidatus Hydrogenedentota bacterium]
MRKLQILGTGCPSCHRLAELAAQAATELHVEFELEKVSDIDRILAFDVPGTPALVIDGEVRVVGRVPSLRELKDMINSV